MPKTKKQDFLSDDCGQNALQLAARGSALVAEILRLTEHIPTVFIDPKQSPQYEKLVCDFSYFTKQDEFEKVIQNSAELLERDEEFRETHIELLERFFKLFRGVFGYATELNRFVSDVREELYISQSLESVLIHPDGKQLLCEIYYLFGVMLLLMDLKMPGKIREHLIVSFIRYKGAGDQLTVEVAGLCRATGYEFGKPPPERYPERYFARVPIDRQVVELLIGRVRSDDVYQMAYHYPAPEHRSTALANQAQLLYVLLFFRPDILHNERQVMREIVDKHFIDNWIIAFYLGFSVDLALSWRPFKAAWAAIKGTLELDNVQYYCQRNLKVLQDLNPAIGQLLREGVLVEQYVLDNIHSALLPKIREANVVLRFFILHSTRAAAGRPVSADYKKSYELIQKSVTENDILTLLLKTSQLEFILKAMFEQLLRDKKQKWETAKQQASTKMTKLSQYFSGEHVLSDNVRVAQLETWFAEIASRIDSLSYNDSSTAGRKVQKLMKALENVQEFHRIDENLQVVQFLHDTRHLLRQLIRIINIERKVLITIGTIGDLSYAWELFSYHKCFVASMQEMIKANPSLVLQMRSAFVKMATMLELPCTRIDQAASNDPTLMNTLENVSEYYSNDLVVFVRKVLHVIPSSIFHVLRQIMNLLVDELQPCETKVNRADLKKTSQLGVRQRLSRLTSEISLFASGILAMESTLVGVIKVDPHQLLEDGIRTELVGLITHELDRNVTFDGNKPLTAVEFDKMLQDLGRRLAGMRNAFEYVQDYVNVHGLRIWLEEFFRIVNFNVEMECNVFMQRKLYHWKSRYQSETIVIPYLRDPKVGESYSFLGRIAQHLLVMTRKSIYVPALAAWYDKDGKQIVGERTFVSIVAAIGAQGLAALDRLLCFNIARESQRTLLRTRKALEAHLDFFEQMRTELLPTSSQPLGLAQRWYGGAAEKLAGLLPTLVESLHRLGRMQLLRKLIAHELQAHAKLNSGALFFALSNANECVLEDLRTHYQNPLEAPLPGSIVAELTPFLEVSGFSDSVSKVYVTSQPMPELPFVLQTAVASLVDTFAFSEKLGCLVPNAVAMKNGTQVDASAVVYGTMTVLKQFHSEYTTLFFGLQTQLVRVVVVSAVDALAAAAQGTTKDAKAAAAAAATGELPTRAQVLTTFLERFTEITGGSVEELHQRIPAPLLSGVKTI